MEILWHSSAPWGTGSYSVLTKRTVPGIVRQGHKVTCNTWYGLQGEPQKWRILPRGKPEADPMGIVTILPSNGDNYGVDTMLAAYRAAGAEVCVSCMDVWVIPSEISGKLNFAPWLPVDHDPCPTPIVDALRAAMYPMCMSKWGTEVLKAAGIAAHYVPCSADSDVFKPGDQKLAREKTGVPADAFLVTMVAANKDEHDRKGFGEALQGFARFAASHEEARLYVHTMWSGAIDINALVDRLGIADKVIKPNTYAMAMGMYSNDDMREIYNASDVLLNPAKSEGFGLPILEAQMCGIPVIVSDFSTTDELLFAGWRIAGQKHWSYGADSWRFMVYVDSVVDCLEEAWREAANPKLKQQARNGAIDLDTETVLKQHWQPALAEIAQLVEKRTAYAQEASA